jgi:2-isopropylmalate synthase
MNTKKKRKPPFFYDVTLRDGNQALRKPWNLKEKERVFQQLLKLGVQGIEVGYSGASEMDFKACEHLAGLAPDKVVICGLARTVEKDIIKVAEAIKDAAKPRIHTFISTSEYNMEHVLKMTPQEVLKRAEEMVALCRELMGKKGSVQFSPEHFGDCQKNLDFVIEVLQAVVEAGADVLNRPNTVERYRPSYFVDMVKRVVDAVPEHVTVAVHNHNDLGMATATTVESYFAGAVQLETTLNGLGERAGNTNMFEVACALYNCGVDVPLNMQEIYESAILASEWARVPIPEKAPLVGSDVVAHRSGIHQDGATKTKGRQKGAYRAMDASVIGRKESDRLAFTSQSGKTAVFEIINGAGMPITMDEATALQPILKKLSEDKGELDKKTIIDVYEKEIFNVKGPLEFIDLRADKLRENFSFKFVLHGEEHVVKAQGTGPVEACFQALYKTGLDFHLLEYKQEAVDADEKDSAAYALSEIVMKGKGENGNGPKVIGRGKDVDTVKANVKAVVNGVNLLFRAGAHIESTNNRIIEHSNDES